MTTITIRINNEDRVVAAKCSLSQALSAYSKASDEKSYVIALNQTFIPRHQYQSTILAADDDIELLSPMAGG